MKCRDSSENGVVDGKKDVRKEYSAEAFSDIAVVKASKGVSMKVGDLDSWTT